MWFVFFVVPAKPVIALAPLGEPYEKGPRANPRAFDVQPAGWGQTLPGSLQPPAKAQPVAPTAVTVGVVLYSII